MKKGIFVIGAESTCTRLITRLFVENGFGGEYGHEQPTDSGFDILNNFDKYVVRRSVPHNYQIPDMDKIYSEFADRGYSVITIVTFRDMRTNVLSQIKDGQHAKDEAEAIDHIRHAYISIFGNIKMPYFIVNLSDLILEPALTQKWLLNKCEVEPKVIVDIVNSIGKYE